MSPRPLVFALAIASLLAVPAAQVLAHGDVTPQAIDTNGLESLGDAWRKENPYRENAKAIEIGASGYNQNCARCHGLEVISGGLAPDLRYLEKGSVGDDWFMERIRNGAKKSDGTTTMPAFEGTFSQRQCGPSARSSESKHAAQ